MTAGRATKMRQPNKMKSSVENTRILVWLTFHFCVEAEKANKVMNYFCVQKAIVLMRAMKLQGNRG